jgi:N-acyl-phosphatidylethanolamine-hydrolysing phospholipase D
VAAEDDRLVSAGGWVCCRFVFSFAAAAATGAALAQAAQHTDGERFRNNYPHEPHQSFWAWKWEQLKHGVPEPPPGGWKIPWVKTDAAALRANADEATLTWIGHASFLMQLAGRNVLFDPQFSERASPVQFAGPRRIVPLPIELEELPRIDVVAISHNHYDHLDAATVKRLAAMSQGGPLFLVPLGLAQWFRDHGMERVVELDWWQAHSEGGLVFTLVPAQHWSKRTLWDANRTLWGGWSVAGGGLNILHTGDLGYSRDAIDIGERLGPFDLALIPIGAYAPRWFMKIHHLDVPEALQVRSDVRATAAIGMHWGTFEHLTDEPLDEPPAWLARERARLGLTPAQFDVMKVGETRRLSAGGR